MRYSERVFVILLAIFVVSLCVWQPAQGESVASVDADALRTGDILLVPLNCYLCNAIEKEEGSIYSHSGVVVRDKAEITVLESLFGAAEIPLGEFTARTQRGQAIRVLRLREMAGFERVEDLGEQFRALFQREFEGMPFDSAMRWDNIDDSGRELLYCSEFVAKFLHRAVGVNFATKPMHFLTGGDFWDEYFHGNVPHGHPGISPEDLQRSPLTQVVGDLKNFVRNPPNLDGQ